MGIDDFLIQLVKYWTEINGLLLLSKTKIYRHTPLKLQMNPFLDTNYFRERQNKLSFRKGHSIWKKKKRLLPDTEKVIECLSRMHWKVHVRFLEEKERVIALSYSTCTQIVTILNNATFCVWMYASPKTHPVLPSIH